MRTRYRLNVVGDFYVADGCCTLCGVPHATAPELFGGFEPDGSVSDDVEHCWVKKQPSTSAELAAMIETMRLQELGCIRYCGSDPDILRRRREVQAHGEIDTPSPGLSRKR
jgi:hypothetical protein